MAINRIDFQGQFARAGDIGAIKAQEDTKPEVNQSAFQVHFEKEKEQEQQSVNSADETRQQDAKFDAREKGKNEYQRRKQSKKKDEDEDEGGVIDMNGRVVGGTMRRSGFDLKI